MTLEELQKAQRELQEKQQNEFIDKLLDMIENFLEKAHKREYEPTQHEKDMFRKIYFIINDMNEWF